MNPLYKLALTNKVNELAAKHNTQSANITICFNVNEVYYLLHVGAITYKYAL